MCDGDKALLVSDRTLVRIAKRNMKGVVPLYYDMKKAKPTELTSQTMYDGLIKAYTSGHIGIYSNNITKIWNCGSMDDEKLNIIKWLCMENNYNIDCAKTLYVPVRPPEYNKLIKTYTNRLVPHFFIYAKDKTSRQVEEINDSPMNMLEKIMPNGKIKYGMNLGKLDYTMLLYDKHFNFTDDSDKIIKLYDYYNTHKHIFYNHDDENHMDSDDLYVYHNIRDKIFELPYDRHFIVDTLVKYLYTERKYSAKKTLWSSFGDILLENLQKNVPQDTKICPICGKRFVDNSHTHSKNYCSSKCYNENHKRAMKNKYFSSSDILET